jgi:molecular chaperone Hsp33
LLAKSLKRKELLDLEVDTILHRLFWEEPMTRFEPLQGAQGPRFACSCSRARVARKIVSLGAEEANSVIEERGQIEVACEFCGVQYHFDPVDTAQLFVDAARQSQSGNTAH